MPSNSLLEEGQVLQMWTLCKEGAGTLGPKGQREREGTGMLQSGLYGEDHPMGAEALSKGAQPTHQEGARRIKRPSPLPPTSSLLPVPR